MAATLPRLPGAEQAAVVAETHLNLRFTAPALAQVDPATEPWTLAGAALVDSAGEEVEVARWPLAPIPANGAGVVVVGIKGESAQLGCPCTLKLWEATGLRTVTLGNVTFPEGKARAQ